MNPDSSETAQSHDCPHMAKAFNFCTNSAMEVDPWREFHQLNTEPDIFWSTEQEGYWVITKASVIEEILTNPEVFSSANNSIPAIKDDMRLIPPNIDPPHHLGYRKIINEILSPKAIEGLKDEIRLTLHGLIDQIEDKGECDFVADLARPFPVAVFLELMGLPKEELAKFSDAVGIFFRGKDVNDVAAARQEVFGFAQRWLQSNPSDEKAHMLRQLKTAEVDGRAITDEELTIMTLTLFFAGMDTVTAIMSFMGHFLATHPEHQQRLRDNPADIPNAVEEMLRRFGIANLCRVLTHDYELHGAPMKKGDLVMVSSAMAGVDESRYQDALAVDFDRPRVRQHSAFGKGIHMCAGARLGRAELNMLWEEVLPRFVNFRMAPQAEVTFLPGTIMSMEHLPIVWDVAK